MLNALRCGLATTSMFCATITGAQERICPSIDDYVATIHDETGQVPVMMGRTAGVGPMMILAGPDGRWTILGARPDGCPFIVMVGDHWQTQRTGIGI